MTNGNPSVARTASRREVAPLPTSLPVLLCRSTFRPSSPPLAANPNGIAQHNPGLRSYPGLRAQLRARHSASASGLSSGLRPRAE